MKVYQRLARAFIAEGTTATFGMMGDGNMYWLYELHKLGVKVHEVRHEGAGLGMADGWARTTNTPGVATATCGPGTTQLATAFVTAARAESPVVAFCGEYPTNDDEYSQRFDQSIFATACEAGFVRLATPEAADEVVRKAFFLARTQRRPIMLSAPMDIQQQEWEDDDPYQPSSTLIPQALVHPDPAAIEQVVAAIAESKLPVIVAGRGARWANAGDAVLALGDRIGALVTVSLLAKNWLADRTEYHAGISGTYASKTAMKLMQEADCVIGVGASLNRQTTEHGYLYPNARYIQIDTRPQVLMSGVRGANLHVHADARVGLEAIERALAARGHRNTGYRTADVKRQLARHYEDPRVVPIDAGTVDPRAACLLLDELIPREIGVIAGNGMGGGIVNMMMPRAREIAQGGHAFGCIGQALPAAMGAVAAIGGKPLVLLDGDAGIMMHIGEFETAVRYGMPLLTIVLNNEALGAEYYKLEAKKMDVKYAQVGTPDIGAIGVAMGGRGRLVRTLDELRAAVGEWLAKPGPMLIDMRISRTVVSIPYRRIHFGMDD